MVSGKFWPTDSAILVTVMQIYRYWEANFDTGKWKHYGNSLTLHIFLIYQHICMTVTSRFQESLSRLIPRYLSIARRIQKKWLFSPINFCAMFFAVGGVSSVAILKIWENRESMLREIRRRFDSNKTRQPEEHDERFDWEGKSSVSYENILSKSDRIMVIYAAQMHNPCSWLAVATVSVSEWVISAECVLHAKFVVWFV